MAIISPMRPTGGGSVNVVVISICLRDLVSRRQYHPVVQGTLLKTVAIDTEKDAAA
jgi:hypothetical protein